MLRRKESVLTSYGLEYMQDGISMLKSLEVLEIVGARSLRLDAGVGRLANLKSLELNSCE